MIALKTGSKLAPEAIWCQLPDNRPRNDSSLIVIASEAKQSP